MRLRLIRMPWQLVLIIRADRSWPRWLPSSERCKYLYNIGSFAGVAGTFAMLVFLIWTAFHDAALLIGWSKPAETERASFLPLVRGPGDHCEVL